MPLECPGVELKVQSGPAQQCRFEIEYYFVVLYNYKLILRRGYSMTLLSPVFGTDLDLPVRSGSISGSDPIR